MAASGGGRENVLDTPSKYQNLTTREQGLTFHRRQVRASTKRRCLGYDVGYMRLKKQRGQGMV